MGRAASDASGRRRVQRFWLCLPAIVLCAADGFATLAGQPAEYWSDGFATVNERHPVAAWFLTIHPLAFAAAGVPYVLLVMAAIIWRPRRFAAAVAVVIAAGHAVAVLAWCRILFGQPLPAITIAELAIGALAVLAWQRGWRGGA